MNRRDMSFEPGQTTMQAFFLETAAVQRKNMVDGQIRTYDVTDYALLSVVSELPREMFVPDALKAVAYADRQVRLGGAQGRRLLSPMVLSRMIQGAEVQPGQRVLDVAGGTGYSAAIFARLGGTVVMLESDEVLAGQAKANLAALGLAEVAVVTGPLAEGQPSRAPYDVIFVNGAIETRPSSLFQQLRNGGRLLAVEEPASRLAGRSGQVVVFLKSAGLASPRPLFDAAAPLLEAFTKAPEFVF